MQQSYQILQSEPIHFCKLGQSICKLGDNTIAYVYLAILLDMNLQVSKTNVTFYISLLHIRVALAPVTLRTCTRSHDPLLPAGVKRTGPFSEYSLVKQHVNMALGKKIDTFVDCFS